MNSSQKRSRKKGRNEPCACGSSLKYKLCCLPHDEKSLKAHFNKDVSLSQSFRNAISLYQAERFQQAETVCRQILQMKAEHDEALHLSGLIAIQKGELDIAVELISRAVSIRPSIADYYGNLGAVHWMQGKIEAAIECYKQALSIKPDYADAHSNMGVVLDAQGNLDAAIECYRKALLIKQDYAEAHNNMGIVLAKQGKLDAAAKCYRKALSIKPDYTEALNNMGVVFDRQEKLDAATECYRKALSIKPDSADAHNGLGSLLLKQGRQEQALTVFEQGLAFNPSHALLHNSLIFAASRGFDDDGAKVFKLAVRFGRQFEARLISQVHRNDSNPDRPIRIGYVSGDFRRHSVAHFFEPVLASHDKRNIVTFCYYNHHQIDSVTRQLMGYADHWRSILGVSDQEAAKLIRQDAIDILVDLSGHSAGNRLLLFVCKPAPIQVTWIGCPVTTGLSVMDYRLTHRYIDPPGWNEQYHTEKLFHLSTSACFRPAEGLPEINALPALKNGYITFASFHDSNKITPATLSLWGEVLSALPSARLVLCPDSSKDQLTREFEALGIPAERLVFLNKRPLLQYLALHGEVDIMLDTFPYNGSTVSRHALWMGVPILTLAGRQAVSRVGLALMVQLELESFVAECEPGFVGNALRWAGDIKGLALVRSNLRGKMQNASFNKPELQVKELEAAYRQMWQTWCENSSCNG